MAECSGSKILRVLFSYLNRSLGKRYGIELEFNNNIGSGLQLIHPYAITVNPKSKIGNNVTLYKGVTIGSIRVGKRAGAPAIGNNVIICANAFVCGGINIGNNVLIAANSYVNFDVPDNSIVIGNPGKVIPKNNIEEIIRMEK